MLFRELAVVNWSWDDETELIIVTSDDRDSVPVRLRSAKLMFGDRRVIWFMDRVVMLL